MKTILISMIGALLMISCAQPNPEKENQSMKLQFQPK